MLNNIINYLKTKTGIEQYLAVFAPVWLLGIFLYQIFGSQVGLIGYTVSGAILIAFLLIYNAIKKNINKKKTNKP